MWLEMWEVIVGTILVGLAVSAVVVHWEAAPRVRRAPSFFTPEEQRLFVTLQRAAFKYVVVAKPRVLDLLYIPDGAESGRGRRRLAQEYVDFALLDQRSFVPVLVIALDGPREGGSRATASSYETVRLTGLPVLRLPIRERYTVEDLTRRIEAVAWRV